MQQRVITAVFFVIAMLAGVFISVESFIVLFTLVAAGSAWEYSGLVFDADEQEYTPRRVFIAGLTGLMVALYGMTAYYKVCPISIWPIFPAVLFSVLAIGELFSGSKHPFDNLGRHFVALLYIALPLVLLCDIATGQDADSGYKSYMPWRVFGLLFLIWTNDTMAYFVGAKLGRRKLYEKISPKKTWEGSIGGALSTMIIAYGFSFVIQDFNTLQWVALGAAAAVFGTIGDLVESMLKRSLAIKDSGSLLPGHGGLLDRFDAFLFYLPFAWLIVRYIGVSLV